MAKKTKEKTDDTNLPSPILTWTLVFVALLIIFNQWQIFNLHSLLGVRSPSLPLSNFKPSFLTGGSGEAKVLGPALLAAGEQPVLAGYGTKIKEFPTISVNAQQKPKTGDVVQDLINALIPTGTPEYATELGVSFDDPIAALKKWGQIERSTKLSDHTAEERWKKITSSFTCDFCCGSPGNPTRITNCGCSHAAAWRGIAKYVIAKHGTTYTDEQILGEMTRWKALWYPGPMIKRIVQEQQSSGGNAAAQVDASSLGNLPGMVGGC